jgi:broad specificity phosphatase PhoE
MTELYLIRHGKASPRSEDYDVLSDKGARQARTTGAWLARSGLHFDRTYVGPLHRQKDTWQLICEQAGEAAGAWPPPSVLPGLAEAPLVALMRRVLPERLPHDRALQQLVLALEDCEDRAERRTRFSRLYRHIVGQWFDDQLPDAGIEGYAAFCTRVAEVLETVVAASRVVSHGTGRIAIVSSMGVIAELLKQTLGWSREHMLEKSEEIANASITTLGFDGTRFSLMCFNDTQHLEADDLVTFM